MTQVVLDITAREAEITRERRDAARLIGEEFEEVATEGHELVRRTSLYRVTVTVTFSPVVIEPSSASARSR